MEGGGTTLAEIYDNDERENYTKIVLQKRMWIHVGEEQLIRREAVRQSPDIADWKAKQSPDIAEWRAKQSPDIAEWRAKQSPDLTAWRARQEAERERIRQLDHTPLPPKRPPKKAALQQNYQNVFPRQNIFAPRPFSKAQPDKPRPVVPPKPVISRELVQNLINNAAAAAHTSSLNCHGAYLAPVKRPISASKSLESLLSDHDPPSSTTRIDRQVSAFLVVPETREIAATELTQAPSRRSRSRPLSGSDDNRLVAAGQRSSTLPAGAADHRLLGSICDNNDKDDLARSGRVLVTPDLVNGNVTGHVIGQGLQPPPAPGQWRSRSLHQLHLAPPEASPGFQIERSPAASEEARGGKKRNSQEMESMKIKQAELMHRISGKLTILREERENVKTDIADNEKKGEKIAEEVSGQAKLQEVDRLRRHMQEVESMTSLLVGLTSRLARVEGEAATLKRKEDMAAIRSKQVKLQTQLAEAKCLQEVMQRRELNLVRLVTSYLGQNSGNTFQSYIRTKCELIMELKEIEDKIKLGEDQLTSLALFS